MNFNEWWNQNKEKIIEVIENPILRMVRIERLFLDCWGGGMRWERDYFRKIYEKMFEEDMLKKES